MSVWFAVLMDWFFYSMWHPMFERLHARRSK